MSRIGKLPIPVASSIQVAVEDETVALKGPKGSLAQRLPPGIRAELEAGRLLVHRADETKRQRAFHGLARALLANAVRGVTQGFTKQLEIHGVGYSGESKGRTVQFKLGHSHAISFPLPPGIEVKIERNLVTVSGCDRQQVGQVAADIRALRPPDVYKHKGIRYAGEQLRKKAGKTGAK
jgi:large subunit ribosomal protein L6